MAETSILLPPERPFVVSKSSVAAAPDGDVNWTRLIFAYVACGTFWLVVGTLAGEYLGLKFAWPDIDHVPWLPYGRLRPVHTNTVFWGWASLAMIGLALYVVPKTSRRQLHSLPLAWAALGLINIAVLVGDVLLMSGVNNAGQEYREYIWPAMGLFAAGLIIITYDQSRHCSPALAFTRMRSATTVGGMLPARPMDERAKCTARPRSTAPSSTR